MAFTELQTGARADPPLRRRRLALAAAVGFLNGYLVLHPAAMVIFALTNGSHAHHGGEDLLQSVWRPFLHSFHLGMLPMALAFGLLGAAIGLVYGAQKQALKAQLDRNAGLERIKRRHIAFLVHDFKGQLNCIEGFADRLIEDDRPSPREALGRIRRQARSMLASVHNLLDLSRLEDTPALRRGAVRPVEILESVASEAAESGREARIEIVESSRDCPSVSAERELIRRVLANLVANAIKHNPPGVRVVLEARPDADGRHVVFSCRDDGAGIPPERQAALFEPFRSGDPASPDSTGLGLSFARTAVEAHGGRIWCDTEPGPGALFRFRLPRMGTEEGP